MKRILARKPAEDGRAPEDPDVAKALVIAEFTRLVEEGAGVMVALESGALELRLATGAVFHLGETAITRIAWPPLPPSKRPKNSARNAGAVF
jgi:hypothetical protein